MALLFDSLPTKMRRILKRGARRALGDEKIRLHALLAADPVINADAGKRQWMLEIIEEEEPFILPMVICLVEDADAART